MKRTAAVLAACLALGLFAFTEARAADKVKFKNQATVLAEYDDNVYKTVSDVKGDFLARIFLDSYLNLIASPTNLFTFTYNLGAKKFASYGDEDTLINQIGVRYLNTRITNSYLGGEGQFKLRNVRDGDEDYNKLILKALAGHSFAPGVVGEVFSGYTRFDFKTYDFYDYWTRNYGVELRKTLSHELNFGIHYIYENKHYPFLAFKNIPTAGNEVFLVDTNRLREDMIHEVGFFIAGSTFVLLNFGYDFQVNESNSYGDAYYNHRFRLNLSKSLTDRINLHLFAIANFRDSYEQVLIPHSFSIEEDDENFNQLVVKANYSLLDWLLLEARYGRFWSQYSVRQFNFVKDTYSLGVTFLF